MIKENYAQCAESMMIMWIANVLTDGEYSRIMDKLNNKYKEESENENNN